MIVIAGDVNLTDGYFDTGFGVGSSIIKGADPFAHLKRDAEDIWIGNFEGVTANNSSNKGIYQKQFIIAPDKLKHIHHFNYYNVANNHAMQHGGDAFIEMLTHLASFGSKCFGTDKCRSVELNYKGKKFSITGFSQRKENFDPNPLYWYNPEYHEIKAEYDKCQNSDFKIAYIHWGNEFVNRPYDDQIKFAHMLIDMGYDLIVGMHPHLLQGYEQYHGKYIYYSIGNFVFNMLWEPLRYAVILNLDVENEKVTVGHRYIYIGADYFPTLIAEALVPRKYQFNYLNTLINHGMNNEEYYVALSKFMRQYKRANRLIIIRNLPKLRITYACAIIRDFIKRHMLSRLDNT